MPKKWHDIIIVYGYEIIVPGNVDTIEFMTKLIKLKTSNFFRIYTLDTSIYNGWDETKVQADDLFPIIGFEVNEPSECVSLVGELDDYLLDNPMFEGILSCEKPKLYSGIDVDSIVSLKDE